MKKITFIALLFASSSFAQIPTDKVAHFGIGYATGSLTSSIALINSNRKNEWWKAIGVGVGSGLAVGLGKELYDQHKYSGFDWKDLGCTVLGSALGSVTIKLTINRYNEKHKKHENNN